MPKVEYSPTVRFTREVWRQIRLFTEHAPGEVSGLMEVEVLDNGDFLVAAYHLIPQESTSGGTEMGADEIAAFTSQAMREGLPLEKLRGWHHSHGSLGTFWSSTDDTTSEELAKDMGWVLCLVTNKKGDARVRVDYGGPGMPATSVDELSHFVIDTASEQEIDAVKAEIAEKVTQPSSSVVVHGKESFDDYGWHGEWGWGSRFFGGKKGDRKPTDAEIDAEVDAYFDRKDRCKMLLTQLEESPDHSLPEKEWWELYEYLDEIPHNTMTTDEWNAWTSMNKWLDDQTTEYKEEHGKGEERGATTA